MTTAKKEKAVPVEVSAFTKEQLVRAKTLGLPRDAVAAVLKDGQTYTKDQAVDLVLDYLKREV